MACSKPKVRRVLATVLTSLFGLEILHLYLLNARPVSFGILYALSFFFLPLLLLDYTRYFPAESKVQEPGLLKIVNAISLGFWIPLFASIVVFAVTLTFQTGTSLKVLGGLDFVWLGTVFLPYLASGPAQLIMLAEKDETITPSNILFANGQALLCGCLLLPGLRKYAFKFIGAAWLSSLLLGFGWYVILGPVGLLSLLALPALLIMARGIVLPEIPNSSQERIRGYVERVASMTPLKPIGVLALMSWFTLSLVYYALLMR